jgi:hypothetical protein
MLGGPASVQTGKRNERTFLIPIQTMDRTKTGDATIHREALEQLSFYLGKGSSSSDETWVEEKSELSKLEFKLETSSRLRNEWHSPERLDLHIPDSEDELLVRYQN